ncbi:syntaxin-binding protein 5 isoform X1 [Condylostylus longicornis]|uniref:syntaxin-binding protein 5 isoform X1 n=1 Tax=Condylostylus longicornis TaxID=2530218 RepID=UPI00244E06A0|nr:syntaxin-binding protein 5 isoform X1 [Condylostylus longicornis]
MTFRHGFPHSPTALAYDSVQKLLVIGDKSGSLRILGRPGVDLHVRHEGDSACAVITIEFLVNEGALVTATADDTLHLWNFRQKFPQVVQSLKFQRERITCIHLPIGSKWLYVGTEKGNIHVVHIETFALSGYVINWNKAIEVTRTTHPGAVVGLCDNPLDANKLLIAFESGQIVLWDMRGKTAEMRWHSAEPLRSIAWHHEGKHFVSSHTDGSLCTWPLRPSPKPQFHSFPHAKPNKDGKVEACKPIHKVDLRTARSGDTFTIFSGGLSMEKGGKSPCITVLNGRSTTVLEMEHPVVDFVTMCETPWPSDMQEPYAIAVLLQNDLVIIDLLTPGFPCFESPYPMDLHESPVTCCTYLADCQSDLVPAFYSVGRTSTSRKTGFSDREWPVSGGEWSPASCSYSEIVITGHQDGSVKFWDASAGSLQVLYKLRTGKLFERPRARSVDSSDEDPLAVHIVCLCAETRRLCIAGASGHVILFKFKKTESSSEILVLEIPISYESFEEGDVSPECEFVPRAAPKVPDAIDNEKKNDGMLKVRPGPQRKPPGFQAQLVCLTPWTTGSHPGQITSLSINSSYGLMAYGNEYGIAVVDIIQKVCLLNVASPDLYGAQDPYSRVPKSPKRSDNNKDEQARSPSIDQFDNLLSASPQKVPLTTQTSVTTTATNSSTNVTSVTSLQPSSSSIIPQLETIAATPIENPVDPSTSGICVLSTSPPLQFQGVTSPRPVSPAAEVFETVTPQYSPCAEEQLDDQPAVGQCRRKSSVWKNINLKRRFSKVKTCKAVSTESPVGFPIKQAGGSKFYYGVVEGTPLSPIEISPDTPPKSPSSQPKCESPTPIQTPTESDLDKVDYLFDLENENSLAQLEVKPDQSLETTLEQQHQTKTATNSSSDTSEATSLTPSQSNSDQNIAQNITIQQKIIPGSVQCQQAAKIRGKKERTMSQPYFSKRYEYGEEHQVLAKSISNTEGSKLSRPSDLPLFDQYGEGNEYNNKPSVPPRIKKKDKREQRLRSVPNIKYAVRDLRGRTEKQDPTSSFAGNLMRRLNKLDSSFSRSRSSSMSSLENISSEAVTCLAFSDSYTKKSDPSLLTPTLWVGTSLGSVLTVSISLPDADCRNAQPVLVSILGGPIFRLKGSILAMSFLDCNGALIPYTSDPWKEEVKRDRTPTKNPNRMSPTLGASGAPSGLATSTACGSDNSSGDRQFIVIASEKQARVVALPSQNCVYRLQITETDFVVKAEIVSMRESVCLAAYLSNGHIMAFSLPSLRPLLDCDFLPLIDLSFQTKCKQGIVDPMLSIWGQQLIVHEDTNQISKTFCFSNKGHGLYLATPTEIQKFTICSEFCQFYNDNMMGELFAAHEMPEPPKESFFKGLFGGGIRSLDREELFGDLAGKANRSVAKHIPGSNLEQLGQRASTATSEISRAHQLAMERGEKLNLLEERAERMSSAAQDFSGTAHSLMLKYKDKKWYQL